MLHSALGGSAWGLLGDFNIVKYAHEKMGGQIDDIAVKEFLDCFDSIGSPQILANLIEE